MSFLIFVVGFAMGAFFLRLYQLIQSDVNVWYPQPTFDGPGMGQDESFDMDSAGQNKKKKPAPAQTPSPGKAFSPVRNRRVLYRLTSPGAKTSGLTRFGVTWQKIMGSVALWLGQLPAPTRQVLFGFRRRKAQDFPSRNKALPPAAQAHAAEVAQEFKQEKRDTLTAALGEKPAEPPAPVKEPPAPAPAPEIIETEPAPEA